MKFGLTCVFQDNVGRQTYRHTDCNISHPPGGKVNIVNTGSLNRMSQLAEKGLSFIRTSSTFKNGSHSVTCKQA